MTPNPVADTEELIIMDDMVPPENTEMVLEEESEESAPMIDFWSEDVSDDTKQIEEKNETTHEEVGASDLFDFSEQETVEVAQEPETSESDTKEEELLPAETTDTSTDIFGWGTSDPAGDDTNMDQILEGTIAKLSSRLDEVQDEVKTETDLETDLAKQLSESQERKANGELEMAQIKKNITAIKKMKSTELKNTHNSNRKKAA